MMDKPAQNDIKVILAPVLTKHLKNFLKADREKIRIFNILIFKRS